MSIGPKEKALLNIYREAAKMKELEYRQLLLSCSGCESLRDDAFDPVHFRAAMARLETLLFARVAEGLIPNPRGRNQYIRSETYWREQARKVDLPGFMTSAQKARIDELLACLQKPLGAQYNANYIGGIVARATRRRPGDGRPLTNAEARNVIDALQDKLKHAVRSGGQKQAVGGQA